MCWLTSMDRLTDNNFRLLYIANIVTKFSKIIVYRFGEISPQSQQRIFVVGLQLDLNRWTQSRIFCKHAKMFTYNLNFNAVDYICVQSFFIGHTIIIILNINDYICVKKVGVVSRLVLTIGITNCYLVAVEDISHSMCFSAVQLFASGDYLAHCVCVCVLTVQL